MPLTTLFRPCVLLRPASASDEEIAAARRHFPVYRYRSEVPRGSLVICRYSALPNFNEVEVDLRNLGSLTVNTFEQHRYIASMDYVYDLGTDTFPTWFRFQDVPRALHGQPFVVKGRTNSRKAQWDERMFARDYAAAVLVGCDLQNDSMLGEQGIVVRQFEELETFEYTVKGQPITNEWRIFYLWGQRVAADYYWGLIDDWAPVHAARPRFEAEGLPFADAIAKRLAPNAPFMVIDIARSVAGQWRVVELNDGQMSGLNQVIDPEVLYANLARVVAEGPPVEA